MGKFRVVMFACVLTVTFFSFCFCLWCTYKAILTGHFIRKESRRRRRRRSNSYSVRRRSTSSASNSSSMIISSTLALCNLEISDLPTVFSGHCLLTITLSQLFFLILQSVAFYGWKYQQSRLYYPSYIAHSILPIFVFLLESSFALSVLVLYERLRSTFENTTNKIPEWSTWLIFWMGVAFLILFLSVSLLSIFANDYRFYIEIPAIILLTIVYVFGMTYLLYAFVSRLFKVAGNISNNLQKNDNSSNNHACQDKVINVAVRMTVCVSVSLFSTILDFCAVYFQSFFCYYHGCGIRQSSSIAIVTNLDLCINAFCILCTLAKSSEYYDFVFGTLHEKYLRFLLKHTSLSLNLTLSHVDTVSVP